MHGYNPHQMCREAAQWPSAPTFDGRLQTEIVQQAHLCWEQGQGCFFPGTPFSWIDRQTLAEYGYDAVRIACLTASDGVPDERLLESAFRLLLKLYNLPFPPAAGAGVGAGDAGAGNAGAGNPGVIDTWLATAGSMQDHLFRRDRPYPALARWRQALKEVPPDTRAGTALCTLSYTLLAPFAPCMARWRLQQLQAWPPPPLAAQSAEFWPLQALRLRLGNGGWHWVTVDGPGFALAPAQELSKVTWVQKAMVGNLQQIEKMEDGWQVFLNQANKTANSGSV